MSLWAIVPVKPLRRAKSRLAGVLTEEERALLNYTLLGSTLKTLSEVPAVDQILVISRDQAALSLARDFKARTVQEDSSSGLNMALYRATVVAKMYSAQEILVLPADLPLISPTDIEAFIRYAQNPPVMVIAPDRRMDGTNALYLNPAGVIQYRFGPGSYQHHIQQAKKNGFRVEVFRSSAFGLDLDTPEDLEVLKQVESLPVEA